MCGRFVLRHSRTEIARLWGIERPVGDVLPRYNITPGRQISSVRAITDDVNGAPIHLDLAHWGYKPRFLQGKAKTREAINARAETAATSPYYRKVFRERRCLIPADGWYEWLRAGERQPHYFSHIDGELMMFAGLWDWTGEGIGTCCAIITEPARGIVSDVHSRMPVVLERSSWDAWLDPTLNEPEAIRKAARHLTADALTAWPVSKRVNKPQNDDAALIEPIGMADH